MSIGNPTFAFDIPDGEKRLGELILYVSMKCADDQTFGATKLNKILWLSDFMAYARYAAPITGVEYQRLANGPAPRCLVPVRKTLVEAGALVISKRQTFGRYVQKRPVPLREPDLGIFTSEQVALVDEVITGLWNMNATETSQWSHGKAWRAAVSDGELIPYEAVFVSNAPIDQSDIARTHELAAQHGWEMP